MEMLSEEKVIENIVEAKKRGDINFIFEMLWDIMFRQVLGSLPGMPLLEVIVSVFSGEAIEKVKGKVKLLTTDLLQNKVFDKNSKSDIIASYDNGRYIIEMNSSAIMITRNNFYAFKVASGALKIGDNSYKTAYNTTLINFNSKSGKQKKLLEEVTLRYEDGRIYDESIKIFLVDIAKALNTRYNYVNKQEEIIGCICRIMTTNDSEVMRKEAEKIMSKEDADNLVERAKELSSDSEMIEFFDTKNFYELVRNTELQQSLEKGLKRGEAKGKKEGESIGANKTARANAKNAINLGLDDETISKITNLSIEEIKALR